MIETNFDLVVIGGGPAGYVAAIKASHLGMKVACVEKRGSLGGTCLNVGCIPSKALLESSYKYEELKHLSNRGINISNIDVDLSKMMKHKEQIVSDLCKGIEGLFTKNKITYFKAGAKISTANTILLTSTDSSESISAKNIIIATGSEVLSLPNISISEKRIVSSTGALSLPYIPKKMIIIGGGYIGLEMGSVWNRLGTEVTVVEFLDKIVPTMDSEIGKQLHKILEKQGFIFRLGAKVLGAVESDDFVELELETNLTGQKEKITSDVVLVSIGRRAFTEGLGLEEVGVLKNKNGQILVDSNFRTNISNIYAIGDVISGPMLAHKAEEEAVACVEILAGQAGHVNYNTIPGVIYTHPEVASVGKTEDEVKSSGINYKVGKFPFLANSRARAIGDTDGMVKIISRQDNDEVLGVHIIGADAGTIISEAVIAMEYKASSEDIARTCHAHPTLNEAVKEAALATFSKAIHI